MGLIPGTRLGAYEVLSALGAGGMGEVYRARDTRLNREVALKILPDVFANDPDRVARFAREAQVLASLNHPHIAQVHGLEEAGTVRALVMELVEGPTLDDRIRVSPLALDEALAIARQIAEALEAAHELGIVHRDLKPANVKVRDDGTVKVLDFGLAKAIEPVSATGNPGAEARALSPTITTPAMTMQGVIIGTAAYMSPEQAKGKPVDRRADIWAFGCVLYEMLSGKRAFDGEDAADTIAAVLTREPDWSQLPTKVPPSIRQLLRKCLERDTRRRVASMAVVGWALADDAAPGPVSLTGAGRRKGKWPAILAGAAALVAAFAVAMWAPWRQPAHEQPLRVTVELGADASLLPVTNVGGVQRGVGASAVLSPDGRYLAFAASKGEGPSQLYVRSLDQLSATPLAGTAGAAAPFFSPDGQWVAFFADGKLKKLSRSGGVPTTLCDVPAGRGGSWGDDGAIVYTASQQPGSSLMRVSAAGGAPQPLTTLAPGEAVHRWAQVLPQRAGVLFTASSSNTGPYDAANIMVLPSSGASPKLVQQGGAHGRYVASGHLLYVNNSTLFAVPFDLKRLATTGPSVPILEGLSYAPDSGASQFSISATGVLAYVTGQTGDFERAIDWMDRTGARATLRSSPIGWNRLTFSPDGRHLAMDISNATARHIWILDWERDAITKLSVGGSDNLQPVWAPDGEGIAFVSNRGANRARNIYWQRADGSGEAVPLTTGDTTKEVYSWHPSGRFLAFTEATLASRNNVMVMPIDGTTAAGLRPGQPAPFVNTPADENRPQFSPDGKWLAYSSDESGQQEVYVRPFPGPGGRRQLSTAGGGNHQWSQNRSELIYRSPVGTLMLVRYKVEDGAFQPDKPQLWSGKPIFVSSRGYALHPDGNRIAIEPVTEALTAPLNRLTIVTGFFDELRRLAPPQK